MAIDQALRTGSWPTRRSLARKLEVNPRTIGRDLTFLRDRLRAPIAFDPRRNGYYYTEPSYRLPCFQVSRGELLALYVADRMMRQFRGTPFEADLRSTLEKLSSLLPDEVSIRLDATADMLSVLPVSEAHYDPTCFCTVLSAVFGRRRLEMVYWSASRNETNRRKLDPYGLALIDDGWQAIGYCHRRQAVRMFAMQRMRSVQETGETFDRPADFRIEDYMKGSFRAIRGDGDHAIALRFGAAVAGQIAERRWHPSQNLDPQPDGSVILRLRISDLREVKRWAMFWGSDCRVLAPTELRESIANEAREMLAQDASNKGGEEPRQGSATRVAATTETGELRDSRRRQIRMRKGR
jgi:predicted DNA-binding transcriptional regulator YafY